MAVYSLPCYSESREAMERSFDGPKILVYSVHEYPPKEGVYAIEIGVGHEFGILEFDAVVKKHFGRL